MAVKKTTTKKTATKKTTKTAAAAKPTKTVKAVKTTKSSKTIRSQIMDFVQKHKNGVHRTDIVKHLRVKIQKEDYDPKRDRGYYSAHLCVSKNALGYLMKPGKTDARYLVRVGRGIYKIAK